MTNLFTSDLHLGHKNIMEYSGRDFSSVHEMNKHFFTAMEKMHKPGDVLYFLGDLSLNTNADKYLDRFPMNQIHFLFGNHDRRRSRKQIRAHKKVAWCGNLKSIKLSTGHQAVLCHYKMYYWNKSHHGSLQLHGHSHGNSPERRNQLDVGIDNAYKLLGEYRPFTEEEVLEQIERINSYYKNKEELNHH